MERSGGFDESLHYCLDREFFLRLGLHGARPRMIAADLARFRDHGGSKTATSVIRFHEESLRMLDRHADAVGLSRRERRRSRRRIRNEMAYLKVFATWRTHGRRQAMRDFLRMVLAAPGFLFTRRVTGQARRLLLCPASRVRELQ
jgi:hypothetical protein